MKGSRAMEGRVTWERGKPGRSRPGFTLLLLATLLSPGLVIAGQMLRVAEDQLPRGINPLFSEHLVDMRVGALLFTGLYTEDRYNQVQPVLAASTTIDPVDPRVVQVQLKPGLKWHDGRAITAGDVKFTIDQILDTRLESPLASQLVGLESAAVLAPDRVALTFQTPPREVTRRLTFPIVPAHAFADAPVSSRHPFRFRPVGAGPYQLDRYDTDGTMRLVRNATYAMGKPAIPRIELREIRDKQIQVEALRYGNLEVVVRVLPRDLPDLDRMRRIELRPYQTNSWWYLGFNLTRPPWSDAGVRQALSELIDIDKLLEPIGGGERITGPFVPSSPFYNRRADIPIPAPDLEDAAARLARAGYTRDGRGRFQRNGVPLHIALAVEKALPVAKEVAVNLQGQLERAGIDVTLVWLDPPGWNEQVVRRKTFDLTLSQWSFDRSEVIYDQFHSDGAFNYVGYRNERVDRWLERARQEIDPDVRRQANQEVHRILAQERPYLFLWTLTQYAAFSSEVRDVAIDPFTFYAQVHSWSLGEKSTRREPEQPVTGRGP